MGVHLYWKLTRREKQMGHQTGGRSDDCIKPDLELAARQVPGCAVAPSRDTVPAPMKHISKLEKEESCSCSRQSLLDAMYNEARIIHLAEIYTVGTENGISLLEESNPFTHGVILHGTKGSIVQIQGVFYDGAMINAIDENVFKQVKRRISKWSPSKRKLKMADGMLIPSKGRW